MGTLLHTQSHGFFHEHVPAAGKARGFLFRIGQLLFNNSLGIFRASPES
jgi:hypothetical protein